MPAIRDALDREVRLDRPAERVLSLVPSETETVAALAGIDRLVGRTEWCEEPQGRIEGVPTVGGTKKIDRAVARALAPDLVLANQEENGRRDVEALIEAGIPVHVSFVRTLAESARWLEAVGRLLGVEAAAARAAAAIPPDPPGPVDAGPSVFVPIWRDPWMTLDHRTYGAAVLAGAGARNAFDGRARLYPLAADLGTAPAIDPGERDTRYPRVTRAEVEARAPDVVLLPDEPFAFGPEHVAELSTWDLPAARTGRIHRVSGKDLFWYGVRSAGAVQRVSEVLDARR